MTNAGISQFILKDREFVICFNEGGTRHIRFDRSCDSVSEIVKKFHKKLTGEAFYASLKDIEHLLEQHKDQLFPPDANSEEDASRSLYLDQVTKLRNQRSSSFSYKDWQLSVAQKYQNLQQVVRKNFPEAWPSLQFCLAVKSILNIDGCTLPFMGVILAIPSSMKTLVIQLFCTYPQSLYTDSFTPASFVSHNAALSEEKLRKVDLLPKLSNILFLTPELSPIFTANEIELKASLGIITRLLDGHGLKTNSGAQGHRGYGATFFVWIGAAVEIPYRVWQILGTLGHKIYFFRPEIPAKTIEQLEKIAKVNDFQAKFKEAEESLLDYLLELNAAPASDSTKIGENGMVKVKWNEEESKEQDQVIACIAQIANLLKRLRGTVYVTQSKKKAQYNSGHSPDPDTSKASTKTEVPGFNASDESDYDTDYPIVEDPSRAVVMLRNLALANAISQGRDYLSFEDIPLIINVALSTTTRARSELVRLLLREGGELTTSAIVNENKISAPFAKKTMRELEALGIVDISAVATYSNSELKITLRDEYK